MEQSTAQRRLVKSPPELWAELSDADILGRHLAEFGDVRITRTDPETTVAWEGDRASGTVELAPAGWGTKVVLTATPALVAAAEPEPEPPPQPVVFRATPVRLAPRDPDPEARRGFFARLFGGRQPAAAIPAPGPPLPDPSPPTPAPDPAPLPPIDPVPPGPGPDPAPQPPEIELDPDRTVAILTDVLDDLGAAHHRPFSRD